ncbi:MAG: laccase domain-containing protein [Nitrospiraceae bacterium]
MNACTICHPDLFYSYRREGAVKATMVSGIVLTAPR